MPSYYELLEIPQDASEENIRKAFRSKSLKFHPDINPASAEIYTNIVNAYGVLSDKSKRAEYDRKLSSSAVRNQSAEEQTKDKASSKSNPTSKKEESDNNTIHISEAEFLFLNPLAQDIGVPLSYVAACYRAADGRYSRLDILSAYLRNSINKLKPALSIEEVLNTTVQEYINLRTAYPYIKKNLMTTAEAKLLTEEERLCIISVGDDAEEDKSWKTLQEYRKQATTLKTKSNPTPPQVKANSKPSVSSPSVTPVVKFSLPLFITSLGESTGLNCEYLMDCYTNDKTGHYNRISSLAAYLINLKKKVQPSLTLNEVLATSQQEKINLASAYRLIIEGKLSIEEAKKLSEKERMSIVLGNTDEFFRVKNFKAAIAAPLKKASDPQVGDVRGIASATLPPVTLPPKAQFGFQYKSNNALICYIPKGTVVVDTLGKLNLVMKPPQFSDTCWYDGALMFANFAIKKPKDSQKFDAIKKCKEETGALFLLEYCYEQLVQQHTSKQLLALCAHKDILSLKFPIDFLSRLTAAINSPERKKALFDNLIAAATKGKEEGLKCLHSMTNKMRFAAGEVCLTAIGASEVSQRISNVNSHLPEAIRGNQLITIMQKDSIIEWLYNFLSIQACKTPSDPIDLYHQLEQSGPILVKGLLGIDSYKTDSAKCLSTHADMQIMGWMKNDVAQSDESLHSTIIVGVKHDVANPQQSRIYFLDPRQTLDPHSKYKQVYSVSYAKFMSKAKSMFLLSDYGLTLERQEQLEECVNTKKIGLKAGFFNSEPVQRASNTKPDNPPTATAKK